VNRRPKRVLSLVEQALWISFVHLSVIESSVRSSIFGMTEAIILWMPGVRFKEVYRSKFMNGHRSGQFRLEKGTFVIVSPLWYKRGCLRTERTVSTFEIMYANVSVKNCDSHDTEGIGGPDPHSSDGFRWVSPALFSTSIRPPDKSRVMTNWILYDHIACDSEGRVHCTNPGIYWSEMDNWKQN
jgi:hypothetical protein